MFGFNAPIILQLHNGHCTVFLMHFSQKRLWQHGVSTASSNISRQIGHSHLSSDREEAAKQVNRIGRTFIEECLLDCFFMLESQGFEGRPCSKSSLNSSGIDSLTIVMGFSTRVYFGIKRSFFNKAFFLSSLAFITNNLLSLFTDLSLDELFEEF